MIQIHDQADITHRLYHSSKWLRELLGIGGRASALSIYPLSMRTIEQIPIVGRADDMDWIRSQSGDALIVGEPGSGKTYLHQELAQAGLCLFVVSDDLNRIADSIRDEQPAIVVVDDAHTKIPLILRLKHLRVETGLEFAIHANCWPASENQVVSTLGIGKEQSCHLDRLSRESILELIKMLGIGGPDLLLHGLLNNAEGKPGLATAMVQACKLGQVSAAFNGETIFEQLLSRSELVSDTAKLTLAILALGGDDGVNTELVSKHLGVSLPDIQSAITMLGAGGIISQVGSSLSYSVRPPVLRSVLVKEVFFGDHRVLRLDSILKDIAVGRESNAVLMRAAQIGAPISADMLFERVHASGSKADWQHFGWLNDQSRRLILEHAPEHVCDAADGLLEHEPVSTLNHLLGLIASEGEKCKKSTRDSIQEHISAWLTGDDPNDPLAGSRRETLLSVIESWPSDVPSLPGELIGWVASKCLSIQFETTRSKPGSGRQFSLIRGFWPMEVLEAAAKNWPRILTLLQNREPNAWSDVLRSISVWVIPRWATGPTHVPDELDQYCHPVGISMLADLLKHHPCRRAAASWARSIQDVRKFDLEIPVDPDFELVMVDRVCRDNYQKNWEQQLNRLITWAPTLIQRGDIEAVQYLLELEGEAEHFQSLLHMNYARTRLYVELSQLATDPLACLNYVVQNRPDPSIVEPFLRRLIADKHPETITVLLDLMDRPHFQLLAAAESLALDHVPDPLWDRLIAYLESCDSLDSMWLSSIEMPDSTKRRLLDSEFKHRAQVAVSVWVREPEGEVETELTESWRDAILAENTGRDYHLRQILETDPELALRWYKARVASDDHTLWRIDDQMVAPIMQLDQSQREELLDAMVCGEYFEIWFDAAVADDPEILTYRIRSAELLAHWFRSASDSPHLLKPLSIPPSVHWLQRINIAIACGCTPSEIAESYNPNRGFGRVDLHVNELNAEIEFLRAIDVQSQPQLAPIVRKALSYLEWERGEMKAMIRRNDVYGI